MFDAEDSDFDRHSHKLSLLGYGYESDSEANISDSDYENSDSPDTNKIRADKDRGEDGEVDEDDMFAGDSDSRPKKRLQNGGFDLDKFERDNELDSYENLQSATFDDENYTEVPLEAFHVREEVETGQFDKDLSNRRKNTSDDEEEPWIEKLGKDGIRKAREAQERRKLKLVQKWQVGSREELLEKLLWYLEPSETPLELLGRLRPKKGKKKKGVKDDDQERRTKVYAITEICEELLNTYSVHQIYDLSREMLMRALKQITGVDYTARGVKRSAEEAEVEPAAIPERTGEQENEQREDTEQDYGPKVWQFRWIGKSDINGPYSSYEMAYWVENYFENRAEARKCGEPEFVHVSKLDFSE